ncbi:MAG: amidotransferase 1, exosortase A system-associated [Gammaproteobacteria bacterium]|nr:MAG: amidotransferase 1, exosortase A system-associated [Gammaproteobacteria bacterium]
MCGIVGIFATKPENKIDISLLQAMNDVQIHRGPDGEGTFVDDTVGLGHRRLSIIDLAGGAQPMYSADDQVIIVYNGEVYNFAQVREELISLGYKFNTHSDTEVLLNAWHAWKEESIQHFRGMFAFAIWDKRDQQLTVVRDRLGIKPLFYTLLEDGRMLFASELKSIMLEKAASRDMDVKAVEDYFALGYIPDPKTIFKGVHKLPPGHYLQIKAGDVEPNIIQYWDVPFKDTVEKNETEIKEKLIEILSEAVEGRMIADVPLGAFLSGGVDSSGVVALMSKLSESKQSESKQTDKPVETCSISFGSKKFNESEYAQMIADRYKTNHHSEQVDADDFDLIDELAAIYDEPYADSSAIPTYRVCQLARKHVTVSLSGDGADELMSGYRRHRFAYYENKVRSRMPASIRKPLFGFLGKVYPKFDWLPQVFRAKSTFQSLAMDDAEGYLHAVSFVPEAWREKLFSTDFKQQLDGYSVKQFFKQEMDKCPKADSLSRIQYVDLKTYLPGDILTKVDRASMAHSLEVRVPILDHKFVEWISGVSPDLKVKDNEGKYIFKKALEPMVPDEILYRPKMGFSVPLAEWFRGPLKQRLRESLLGDVLKNTGVFDMEYIKWLVDQHQSGMRDFSTLLWSLLMFEAFCRKVYS